MANNQDNETPDISIPENKKVLELLKERQIKLPMGAWLASHDNNQSSVNRHCPEITNRIWQELGDNLPSECKWAFGGFPLLLNPKTGKIIVVGVDSNAYALLLTPDDFQKAKTAGAVTSQTLRDGAVINLKTLGKNWVFGVWRAMEKSWVCHSMGL